MAKIANRIIVRMYYHGPDKSRHKEHRQLY